MKKTMLGIDIGNSDLKIVQVSGGKLQKAASAPLPENLVHEHRIVSVDALAQELRKLVRAERFRARHCALVLPPENAFVRKINVPYMTVDQLRVNLPYEFHDYIQSDKDLYFYDYAVTGTRTSEEGKPMELELLAAAISKENIAQYRALLRKAGLKLVLAVPEVLTYRNLIRSYERKNQEHPPEYCVADMGYSATRVNIYRGDVYDTTRVIEFGAASLDAIIADTLSVDIHVAAEYRLGNYNSVQELPQCQELYTRIAVEIMRAVNFYGFNTPDANLQDIYLSGGLAKVEPLMEEIRKTLDLACHPVQDLMPGGDSGAYAAAMGAVLQSSGR